MKLIKQLHDNRILSTAKQKTYENVKFHRGFVQFMESLAVNNLISSNYTRNKTDTGILWDNQLLSGGIIFETNNNPFLLTDKDHADIVSVIGNKQALETFEYLMKLNNVIVEMQSDPQDIQVTVEYHNTLNPDLWEQDEDGKYHLLPEVSDALIEAAKQFIDFLDMPYLEIQDVTITGSSANYNWTQHSDIDLHVLVNVTETEEEYGDLVHHYFDAQRKIWNDQHDITMNGIPVEFYVQDTEEEHHSTGIYSIQHNEWIEEPKKEKPELDYSAIKAKSAEIMKQIDRLVRGCNKADPIEKLMDKIIKMRKAGLEESGEFSTENYVYKVLRNKGYIDKLAECKLHAIDRELSIDDWDAVEEEEEEDDHNDPWADIGYTRRSPVDKQQRIKEPRTRINLNVPYSQRESAKRMGARWDAGIRKWYMMVTNEDLKKIPNAWR